MCLNRTSDDLFEYSNCLSCLEIPWCHILNFSIPGDDRTSISADLRKIVHLNATDIKANIQSYVREKPKG